MNIVVTTIAPPTTGMVALSQGMQPIGGTLFVVGDRKGPFKYELPNVDFYSLERQHRLEYSITRLLPEGHYVRKNLGYLVAMEAGSEVIVETDDDNIPLPEFWVKRELIISAEVLQTRGWINAYSHFTSDLIWPRGLPLQEIQAASEPVRLKTLGSQMCESPIQQGLANGDPDVDAIYRLTRKLPLSFDEKSPLFLPPGAWCPFNSQNTTFFPVAYPLLYLPSNCTFRMTDIWRSFIAQRCLWAMKMGMVFTSATVYQERNEHNLMRDFEHEIPGYQNNARICSLLEKLSLCPGRDKESVCSNLIACYRSLVEEKIFPPSESTLVEAWCADVLKVLK